MPFDPAEVSSLRDAAAAEWPAVAHPLRSRGCFLTLTGMALTLSKTYDAFRVAGAPDDKAREAAEEIAGFEVRLSGIESDVKLLKWMAGFNVALSMAILAILLRLLAV